MPDESLSGSNCPDDVKRSAYLEALSVKREVEEAKAVLDKITGRYRNVLKKWEKMGVSSDAIVYALKMRHDDPDEIVIDERDKLSMLEISGVVGDVKGQILARLDVAEPTVKEGDVLSQAKACDLGSAVGRRGISADANPYKPGSAEYVQWKLGWTTGQQAIADEMEEGAAPAQPPKRGRPPGVKNKKGSIADRFQPDTAETVRDALDADASIYADDRSIPVDE